MLALSPGTGKRIAGIDPGLYGALAAIEGDLVLDAYDIPLIGDAPKQEIDVNGVIGWLKHYQPDHVFIENVRAMPSLPDKDGNRRGMGAASAFKFGFACGQLRACVVGLRIPLTLVEPAVWKRSCALKGGDKEGARQLAIRLYPDARDLMKFKKDHQRAEAILLARWGAIHRMPAAA